MSERTILHEIIEDSPELAATTKDRYLRDLNSWIGYAGAEPAGWTRKKAQTFYNELVTRMRPQSANRLWTSVQYAARWLAHREDNPSLDFAKIQQAGARDKIAKFALTDEQAALMLRICRPLGYPIPTVPISPIDLRDAALITVGLETGMRRMSLTGMTIDETAITPDQITKTAIKHPHTLVPTKGSNGDKKPIPLSNTAIASLTPWLQWLADNGARKGPVFRGLAWRTQRGGQNELVPSATAISAAAIQKLVAGRGQAAGIHVYPHMFRHTYITWRSAAGCQPHEIASVTGHALNLGALGGYMDMAMLAAKMRETTPEWLKAMWMKP